MDRDNAYEEAVDNFLTGDIHLLSPSNILYFISKYGLGSLSDTQVLDIKAMRDNKNKESKEPCPF